MEEGNGELLPKGKGEEFKKVEQEKAEGKTVDSHPAPKPVESKDEKEVVTKTTEELGKIIEEGKKSDHPEAKGAVPTRSAPARTESRITKFLGSFLRREVSQNPPLSPEQREQAEKMKDTFSRPTREWIAGELQELDEDTRNRLANILHDYWFDFRTDRGERFAVGPRFLFDNRVGNPRGQFWAAQGVIAEHEINAHVAGRSLSPDEEKEDHDVLKRCKEGCDHQKTNWDKHLAQLQKKGARVDTFGKGEEENELFGGYAIDNARQKVEIYDKAGKDVTIFGKHLPEIRDLYGRYIDVRAGERVEMRDMSERDLIRFLALP